MIAESVQAQHDRFATRIVDNGKVSFPGHGVVIDLTEDYYLETKDFRLFSLVLEAVRLIERPVAPYERIACADFSKYEVSGQRRYIIDYSTSGRTDVTIMTRDGAKQMVIRTKM